MVDDAGVVSMETCNKGLALDFLNTALHSGDAADVDIKTHSISFSHLC